MATMPVQLTSPVPTALRNTDLAVARYGELGRRWLEGMTRGDPLTDAVVADGAQLVRRAIAEGIEAIEGAPDSLVALFAALDDRPAWMDGDRCGRAAECIARQSPQYGVALGAASLVSGAQNTLAGKPLTFTGRYASNAAVRSIEVGSWLLAVTSQGGLERHGVGFERTVRVRVIHAHVRARLHSHPGWQSERWGLPIPQPYMAFTLAEFCSIALRAMAQLGVRYSDSELEDIHHMWRCVGHLLGVEEDFLPITADDYARIEALYALTSPGSDDGDRTFVAALTEFQAAELARILPARWTHAVVQGLQRSFVGDAVADDLAIPDTWCKRLPLVIGPVSAFGYGAIDTLVPRGKERRSARAARTRVKELERLREQYGVAHELVDDSPELRSRVG
jgi:hypothetical protein